MRNHIPNYRGEAVQHLYTGSDYYNMIKQSYIANNEISIDRQEENLRELGYVLSLSNHQTRLNVGDIISHKGVYYRVIQTFQTDNNADEYDLESLAYQLVPVEDVELFLMRG